MEVGLFKGDRSQWNINEHLNVIDIENFHEKEPLFLLPYIGDG